MASYRNGYSKRLKHYTPKDKALQQKLYDKSQDKVVVCGRMSAVFSLLQGANFSRYSPSHGGFIMPRATWYALQEDGRIKEAMLFIKTPERAREDKQKYILNKG